MNKSNAVHCWNGVIPLRFGGGVRGGVLSMKTAHHFNGTQTCQRAKSHTVLTARTTLDFSIIRLLSSVICRLS